jgi:hypothetical protein
MRCPTAFANADRDYVIYDCKRPLRMSHRYTALSELVEGLAGRRLMNQLQIDCKHIRTVTE